MLGKNHTQFTLRTLAISFNVQFYPWIAVPVLWVWMYSTAEHEIRSQAEVLFAQGRRVANEHELSTIGETRFSDPWKH